MPPSPSCCVSVVCFTCWLEAAFVSTGWCCCWYENPNTAAAAPVTPTCLLILLARHILKIHFRTWRFLYGWLSYVVGGRALMSPRYLSFVIGPLSQATENREKGVREGGKRGSKTLRAILRCYFVFCSIYFFQSFAKPYT